MTLASLVGGHRPVVALRLALLGAEVLHGLVVEQAVDGLGVGLGVALVHGAADLDAPVGRPHREPQVERRSSPRRWRRSASRTRTRSTASTRANSTMVGTNVISVMRVMFSMPSAAALQHARQPAGLALQVEAQRQAVHVLEGVERQLAHGVHGDLGEHALAHLHQQRHGDARERRRAAWPAPARRPARAASGRPARCRRPPPPARRSPT